MFPAAESCALVAHCEKGGAGPGGGSGLGGAGGCGCGAIAGLAGVGVVGGLVCCGTAGGVLIGFCDCAGTGCTVACAGLRCIVGLMFVDSGVEEDTFSPVDVLAVFAAI